MHTVGMKIVHRAQPSWGIGEVLGVREGGRLLEVRFPGRPGPSVLVSAKDPAVCRYVYAAGEEVVLVDGAAARVRATVGAAGSALLRYEVERPDGRCEAISEVEIVPHAPKAGALELLAQGSGGKASSFALRDRAVRLDLERRADALGAMFGSRVMPKPHQLSVVQRVLSAPSPRFVLADEVGLGKTIEAGMIYAAMAQTGLAKRVLVVTPAHLTVQWLAELYNKFHSLFTLLDGERLAREAENHPLPAWWRYDKVVTSLELLARSEEHREAIGDPEGRWDLVIFDEAHHLVSPRAYEVAEAAADNSFGLLLLTATPLQLDPAEHFRLLTLVDPVTPETYEEFEARLERQGELSERIRELLAASDRRKAGRIAKAIAGILSHDEELAEMAQAIAAGEAGATEDFIAHIAEAYSISSRLIRNRRAVVGGLAPRKLVRHDVRPSPEERAFQQRVREAIASGALKASGAALASLLKRLDSSPRAAAASLLKHGHEELAAEARSLEASGRDSKARALLELLARVRAAEPDAKLLIFTEARETLEYVREVLGRGGWPACVYHGDLPPLERDRQVARFRDPEGPPILISSEVGGEGRNFQFCHHLVNYDLAWSPAAIEQRIGRLDRIGQLHEVQVHCFRVEGTVGAHVFDLMSDSVRVFDETVGGLDPVLERVEADLARLAARGDDEAFAGYAARLGEGVARAREEVRRAYDPLLDARSYDPETVRALVERGSTRLGLEPYELEDTEECLWRIARELDERLEETVIDLARKVGIRVDCDEQVEAFQCSFQLGGEMAVDRLPGFDPEADRPLLGSFWRDTAVVEEENHYFTTGHPLVEALFTWIRDGEEGRATWLYSDGVRQAAVGFAFTFLVHFPEAPDLAEGSLVPSRQASRYLDQVRYSIAVEMARGGGAPRVRDELLEDLEDPDAAPAPRGVGPALERAVQSAYEAARKEAQRRFDEQRDKAIARLEQDLLASLERLRLAMRRAEDLERHAISLEAERLERSHDRALASLQAARLELDQAAGLLPR